MKATQEQAVVETSVFWDVKTCPVPPECDAGLVGVCIKRYLEKLGYCGPLTIVAVGLLSDVSVDVLRVLSSTGIVLNHTPLGSIGILRSMNEWKQIYPPPTNMMLISTDESIIPRIRHSRGYNILRLFSDESLWKDFLLQDSDDVLREDKAESPYWLCSVCTLGLVRGFEHFITHLSSQEHAYESTRIDEDSGALTWVLWDIDSCPIPPECDPRRVRPLIKKYLEDFGYSGSFTITATGLLTDVPHDVLRALLSTGIDLHHISFDCGDILSVIYSWMHMDPRPATILLISQFSEASVKVVGDLQDWGCNVIELFPYNSPYSVSLWKTFLLETLEKEEDMCSETGEHASWLCSKYHDVSGQGFDNLITHLSQEHEQDELFEEDEQEELCSLPVEEDEQEDVIMQVLSENNSTTAYSFSSNS